MEYKERKPNDLLENYIDAYWSLSTINKTNPVHNSILPDGCTDIIFNIGDTFIADDTTNILKPGGIYIIGTMTINRVSVLKKNTLLNGIRFKPGAYNAFFENEMGQFTDGVIDLNTTDLREIIYKYGIMSQQVESFFLKRLPAMQTLAMSISHAILKHKGQVKINQLLDTFAMSERKLERLFLEHVGVSPQQLSKIYQFTSALSSIKNNHKGDTLLKIALENGYYDHSHLSKSIKKFTGRSPKEWYK